VPGERANDREAISIKGTGGKSGGCAWKGDRTYLGRSAARHGIVTEGGEIHSDRAAESAAGVVPTKVGRPKQ